MARFFDLALETQEQIWKYALHSPRAYNVELRSLLLEGNKLPGRKQGDMGETGTTGVADKTRIMVDEISATLGREIFRNAEKLRRSLQVVVPPRSATHPLAENPLPAADGLSPSAEPANVA